MTSQSAISPTGNIISKQNTFSDHQKRIQQILAVTFASISILLALLSIYWFYRLKRNFRHELIMLLIVSDMFKATWYFVPAIVNFIQNRAIPSKLCWGSGFLLSVGVESADFIILLIAVHTALAVFRSGKSSGLRPYRLPAYCCWAVFSIVLPGLAFVNPAKGQAYVSQGTYCYFPAQPIWYRLALAWIPRYVILLTVVTIYISIYVYTTVQFGRVHERLSNSQLSTTTAGLDGTCDRRSASVGASRLDDRPAFFNYGKFAPRPGRSSQLRPSDLSPEQVIRRQTLLEALRDKNLFYTRRNSDPRDANYALRKRHRAIRRQLRYMFIYPLVYLLMWLAPFVAHCYYYTRNMGPPFVANSVALVCLCSQCAVDCLIFNIRERPWRYAKNGHIKARRRSSMGRGTNSEVGGQDVSHWTPETDSVPRAQIGQQPRRERHWWDIELT